MAHDPIVVFLPYFTLDDLHSECPANKVLISSYREAGSAIMPACRPKKDITESINPAPMDNIQT